ncbi:MULTISPECIES: virulence RhuM family protein [unclassified Leucobacter]|uniref:virulence RhuM family protein n=1 Tax=unclassified Leucobacter TaxID=2621730 RepID=UPI0030182B4D
MPDHAGSGATPRVQSVRNSTVEFLLFTSHRDDASIEARYEDGTIWLTQKLMAELFGVDVRTISEHLQTVFREGELEQSAVIRKIRIPASDGKHYAVQHYDLDAIISVGYRVNSKRATHFRQWATTVLRDFALTGYVLDRKRMENGSYLGEDYFERLLEEIREIRLSERRFHQKVTDIFATSLDYNPASPLARTFFATVQNKLHFAVHGRTAAELVHERADAHKPHMGMVTWENAPDGKILQRDVNVAKNYLDSEELDQLARLVSAFLELAEGRARRRIPMTMEDWAKNLDAFLTLDGREVLSGAGAVSHGQAELHARSEFEKFRVVQDRNHVSAFDRFEQLTEGSHDDWQQQ